MNDCITRTSDLAIMQGDALLESGIAKIADFGLSKVVSSYSAVFPRPASESCYVRSSRSLQDTPSTELDIHRPQSKPGQAPIDSPLSEASCSRQAPAITQVQCHSAPIIAVDTGAVSAARNPGWNDDVRGVAKYSW